MCTIPPPPPPPPKMEVPANTPTTCIIRSPTIGYPGICEWASEYPELWEACVKNNISLHRPPYKYKYKHFESIMQVGPTCGLVALSMLVRGKINAQDLLPIARVKGYSNNGELFSCKDMLEFTETVLTLSEVKDFYCKRNIGQLYSHRTIEKLLEGSILFVPYDADFNHSPCLRHGHTAHWALVCGVIVVNEPGPQYNSDPSNVYVLCKHGKSKYLVAWKLSDLEASNANLWEFSPKKKDDGLTYVLPEGGIGGENGLREQFIQIEGVN